MADGEPTRRREVIIFALAVLGLGAMFIWFFVEAQRQSQALEKRGVAVVGEMLSTDVTPSWGRSGTDRNLWITVRYADTAGVSHQANMRVYSPEHAMLKRGATVDLRYLPEAPQVVELIPGQIGREAWAWLGYALMPGVIGFIFLLWGLSLPARGKTS